jgi:hypothetical protein
MPSCSKTKSDGAADPEGSARHDDYARRIHSAAL